jgi:hypothetical protein
MGRRWAETAAGQIEHPPDEQRRHEDHSQL